MKKVFFIFLSVVLFTIGCEKETLKSDKLELKQIELKKPELSELELIELKVEELGIKDLYNIETVIHNPNNIYESFGILHNYGLDMITKKMEGINLTDFSKEVLCNKLYEFSREINLEIPKGLLEKMPFEKPFEESDILSETTLNSLVTDGFLNNKEKNLIVKLRTIAEQSISLKEFQNNVISIENGVLADNSLTKDEKEKFLITCAISRYSAAYWESQNLNSSKPLWLDALFFAISDAMGGMIGLFIGGPIGLIFGSIGLSYVCAYVLTL